MSRGSTHIFVSVAQDGGDHHAHTLGEGEKRFGSNNPIINELVGAELICVRQIPQNPKAFQGYIIGPSVECSRQKKSNGSNWLGCAASVRGGGSNDDLEPSQ